jgi:organic hydroperoxide reductase OsmC/OhrA
LQVEVDGGIRKAATGYSFGEVFIRANLVIPQEEERARALKLLHKTKSLCLVSRALSIEQRFEPQVQVGEPHMEVSQALPASDQEEKYR